MESETRPLISFSSDIYWRTSIPELALYLSAMDHRESPGRISMLV